MADRSRIEWTEATWNPVTGCDRVSAGCRNCYAERMSRRLQAMGQPRYADGFAVRCHVDLLDKPLWWRKGRHIFVCSMSDLFHESVPFAFIAYVFAAMYNTSLRHTFQVLTKRAGRMRAWSDIARHWVGFPMPLPNVWYGTTVEHQDTVDRLDDLRATAAAVRFVSFEPLLGPVEVDLDEQGYESCGPQGWVQTSPALDWAIIGGESGPKARPCDVSWIRLLLKQCKRAGVPAFVKQLGSNPVASDPSEAQLLKAGTGKHSDPSLWPEDLRVRQYPLVPEQAHIEPAH